MRSKRQIIIEQLLQTIEPDPKREGLLNTPKRVDKAFDELFEGYDQDPKEILGTVFEDGACDEMVILSNIKGFSTCEHHMLPFSFVAHIGYLPKKKVVGVSKLARLTRAFARRLQIQEKMTSQIADAIFEHLDAAGCMVVVKGQHLCMQARGVKQPDSVMITSAIRGSFRQHEVRQEFLSLIGK